MAYNTEELKAKALEAIQKHKLIWIEEVASAINISKVTFYDHKLNEVNEIKAAIEKNRVDIKGGLRKKWYESDNATVQIALYRLTSTDEELAKLNSQKLEHTGEVKSGVTVHIVNAENPIPESESDVSGQ